MNRSQLLTRLKAANYSGRVGATIVGRLKRGAGGKFASAGSGGASATEQQPRVTSTTTATRPSADTRRTLQQRRQRLARQAQEARRMMNSRVKVQQRKQQKQGGGGGKGANSAEAKLAAQQANRAAVAEKTALSPESVQVLARLADGETVETMPAELAQNGLIDSTGVTDQGRRYLRSAERGNVREALAAIQDGRAAVQRKVLQQRRQTRRKAAEANQSHIAVFKASDGSWMWIARSGTAYLDRDAEIIPMDVLRADSERMTADADYGPLRYWHKGDVNLATGKAAAGIDIGDCTGSIVMGKTRIEWGTFRKPEYARMVKADDEISIGFVFAPRDLVAQNGHNVYTRISTFERSFCPRGTARNPYTGVAIHRS